MSFPLSIEWERLEASHQSSVRDLLKRRLRNSDDLANEIINYSPKDVNPHELWKIECKQLLYTHVVEEMQMEPSLLKFCDCQYFLKSNYSPKFQSREWKQKAQKIFLVIVLTLTFPFLLIAREILGIVTTVTTVLPRILNGAENLVMKIFRILVGIPFIFTAGVISGICFTFVSTLVDYFKITYSIASESYLLQEA